MCQSEINVWFNSTAQGELIEKTTIKNAFGPLLLQCLVFPKAGLDGHQREVVEAWGGSLPAACLLTDASVQHQCWTESLSPWKPPRACCHQQLVQQWLRFWVSRDLAECSETPSGKGLKLDWRWPPSCAGQVRAGAHHQTLPNRAMGSTMTGRGAGWPHLQLQEPPASPEAPQLSQHHLLGAVITSSVPTLSVGSPQESWMSAAAAVPTSWLSRQNDLFISLPKPYTP